MHLEIGLWRIDRAPVKVHSTSISLESTLEELIEQDPTILSEPVMLIGRQVPTAFGKLIDLLGIDSEGNLQVLELKRDRTPREVVAQILDYGSWIEGLTGEDIRQIFSNYRQGKDDFDQSFADRFGQAPPDELNIEHKLTVVAGEIDPATERIITYLSRYNLPINVVFFRHFADGDRSYLARSWLIEEVAAASSGRTSLKRSGQPWNGQDWFVSFGEETGGRSWEDARTFGFVSAGGCEWYSRTLKLLPVGGRILVNTPKSGYVGVGTVAAEVAPFSESQVEVSGLLQHLSGQSGLQGNYKHDGPEDGKDRLEYVVRVTWKTTVPRDQALWVTGMFANQNSACKLRSRFTIDQVSERLAPGGE